MEATGYSGNGFTALIDICSRIQEDHSIAGGDEALRYIDGTSYPENSDYILFAREINNYFSLKGKHIAEFCTGPGWLARQLCDYNPASVTGVDASEFMIGHASSVHSHYGLQFRQADVFDSAVTEHFDIIVCQNSLHHFSNEEVVQFFNSGLSSLKPGGIFYIADYRRDATSHSLFSKRFQQTNINIRTDFLNTLNASFTIEELDCILRENAGLQCNYEIFIPDTALKDLKADPDFAEIVDRDPHPHWLDWNFTLRVKLMKGENACS